MKLQPAQQTDIPKLRDLVNLAYRGETGWTRETGMISGERVTDDEIAGYLLDPNAHLMIVLDNKQLIACVCIEQQEQSAQIGMFAVHPQWQGRGVGKQILELAERYAAKQLGAERYVMAVVSGRDELIEFYQRRGYTKTGKVIPFPVHRDVGTPLVKNLTVEYLEKPAPKDRT